MWFFGPNIAKMHAANDLRGLENALQHKDEKIREAARIALAEIDEESDGSSAGSTDSFGPAALFGKIFAGASRRKHLDSELTSLTDTLENGDTGERLSAIAALSELPHNQISALLVRALRDEEEEVRMAAARTLAARRDPAIISDLRTIMDHSAAETRRAALTVINNWNDPNVAQIVRAALHDRNDAVRVAAMNNLRTIPDPSAADSLLEALGDPETEVRIAAAGALRFLKDDRGVEPLLQMLEVGDQAERIAACQALGSLEDSRAIAPLIAMFTEGNENTQHQVVYSLSAFRDARLVPMFIEALKNPAQIVVIHAASGLEAQKDRSAVDPLIECLERIDEDEAPTRDAVMRALGSIGDARAVDAIVRALVYTDSVHTAVVALANILRSDSAALTDASLDRLVMLKDTYVHVYERDYGAYTDEKTYDVDCRPIKSLAEAEKARRGI